MADTKKEILTKRSGDRRTEKAGDRRIGEDEAVIQEFEEFEVAEERSDDARRDDNDRRT